MARWCAELSRAFRARAVPWKILSQRQGGGHPEKHFSVPEKASFLAKNSTRLLERFQLGSQKDFLRQSSPVLKVGEEHHDFAALLPTLLALRLSCLRQRKDQRDIHLNGDGRGGSSSTRVLPSDPVESSSTPSPKATHLEEQNSLTPCCPGSQTNLLHPQFGCISLQRSWTLCIPILLSCLLPFSD